MASPTRRIQTDTSRFYIEDGLAYPSVTTILSAYPKPFLAMWRGKYGNKEANRISKQSTSIGTWIHAVTEKNRRGNSIEGDIENLDEHLAPFCTLPLDKYGKVLKNANEIKKIYHQVVTASVSAGLAQWLNFRKEHVTEVHQIEERIVSKTYGFAGQCDAVETIKGDRTMVDDKSSNYLFDGAGLPILSLEPRLQTVAYLQGAVHLFGEPITKRGICHFDKGNVKVDPDTQEYNVIEGRGFHYIEIDTDPQVDFDKFLTIKEAWTIWAEENKELPKNYYANV